jgi:hypothetical protein
MGGGVAVSPVLWRLFSNDPNNYHPIYHPVIGILFVFVGILLSIGSYWCIIKPIFNDIVIILAFPK